MNQDEERCEADREAWNAAGLALILSLVVLLSCRIPWDRLRCYLPDVPRVSVRMPAGSPTPLEREQGEPCDDCGGN